MSTLARDLQPNSTVPEGRSPAQGVSFGETTLAIVRELQANATSSTSFDQLLGRVGEIALAKANCLDIWICRKGDRGEFTNISSLAGTCKELEALVSDQVLSLCRSAQSLNGPGIASIEAGIPRSLIAVPIPVRPNLGDPVELILVGLFDREGSKTTDPVWFTVIAGHSISQWVQSRTGARADADKRLIIEINRACLQLVQSQSVGHAARILVNSIRRLTGVQHVALAIDESLIAVSGLEQLDPQTESNQRIRAACCASLKTGSTLVFRSGADSPDTSQLHLQAFCRSHHFDACASFPLGNADWPHSQSVGLLIAGPAQQFVNAEQIASAQQIIKSLGDHFLITLQAHRTIGRIAKETVGNWVHRRWSKMFLCVFLGWCALMVVPMPYRIHCDCEIQPVSRRFIVAPFEGILERSLVQKGDVVARGDVLAKLDGRLMRIELAGLTAELAGARKRFDSELAAGNIAQSQIAKSEMERLKAKINLLNERTETLDIRSPIDGVVVFGDLEKAEGASLTIGQALFEIAPLDQMIVEVAIPESEIQYAKPEMNVAVKLNAFPYRTWNGTLRTIHPRAEIIDNESCFVAQVTTPNEGGDLRPGMKGKAKIKSDWACLGWSLFHRPWETVRFWTVW
jgi:hypothetical protein